MSPQALGNQFLLNMLPQHLPKTTEVNSSQPPKDLQSARGGCWILHKNQKLKMGPYRSRHMEMQAHFLDKETKARTHSKATRDTSLFQQMDHQSCRNSFHRRELRPEGGGEGRGLP